jgi:hypothetical protein
MNQDFRDLLAEFNARQVEYLIVGGHALAAHGLVRATKDLDVWIRPHPENAPRVLVALASFGAPLQDLTLSFPRWYVAGKAGQLPTRLAACHWPIRGHSTLSRPLSCPYRLSEIVPPSITSERGKEPSS